MIRVKILSLFLVMNKHFLSLIIRSMECFKNYTLNRVLFGFKPEIGFDYCFANRFMLGLNTTYHINIGSIGKCNFSNESKGLIQKDLYGETFLFMLTLGYFL